MMWKEETVRALSHPSLSSLTPPCPLSPLSTIYHPFLSLLGGHQDR